MLMDSFPSLTLWPEFVVLQLSSLIMKGEVVVSFAQDSVTTGNVGM